MSPRRPSQPKAARASRVWASGISLLDTACLVCSISYISESGLIRPHSRRHGASSARDAALPESSGVSPRPYAEQALAHPAVEAASRSSSWQAASSSIDPVFFSSTSVLGWLHPC